MNNILNTGGGLKAYDRQIEYLATSLAGDPQKYEPQRSDWLKRRETFMAESFEILSDTTRCLGELIKQRKF